MSKIKDNAALLETEPIGSLLLRYSLPAIATMTVFALYNVIDSVFIGQGLGALALSGMAVAFPVMNLTVAFGTLIGVGGAAICSIRMGQKDMDGASHVLGMVATLSPSIGIGLCLISLPFLKPVLVIFGGSSDTLQYAYDFMEVTFFGLPCTYATFNLNHIMRASGYPTKALITALITVIFNIALVPLFIFTFHWGMRGAAWATVLAQLAGLIWILYHFSQKKSFIHFRKGITKLQWDVIKTILFTGLPPFFINVTACGVVAVINLELSQYGGDLAIGAYGIVNRMLVLIVMVVLGLAQGMQPIVGYNYGAQQIDRVKQTLFYGLLSGASITTVGFLSCFFFPDYIAKMFTDDVQLIEIGADGLRLCTLAYTFAGIQIILANFFQSLGRAKVAIFLSLTRQLIFLLPGLILFPTVWGVRGVWISHFVADILACITCTIVFLRFRAEMRRHHKVNQN